MARRPSLGGGGFGGSISPFRGGAASFSAFDLGSDSSTDPSRLAYLNYQKVQTDWQAGRVDNATYLAALQGYVDAIPKDSSGNFTSTYYNAVASLESAKYQLARDTLVDRVSAGLADTQDLLAFDAQALTGLNPGSKEYGDRLALYYQTQAKVFGDLEDDQLALYKAGRLTSLQLQDWYKAAAQDSHLRSNPQLLELIQQNIAQLTTNIQTDRDQKFLSDFSDGKIAMADFIAYATSAQRRYVPGTADYDNWSKRISEAKDRQSETSLNYRYNLYQRSLDLQKFIADNGAGLRGNKSTSTRRIWDGAKWVDVTSTTYKAPTAEQTQSYNQLQAQVKAAKAELARIQGQAKAVGGFVTTPTMVNFYKRQQASLAVGSEAWYNIQSKLDGLYSSLASEKASGIITSSPVVTSVGGGGGSAGATGGVQSIASGDVTIERFMAALASVESGGRYTAVNANSGAYGKYQFIESSWQAYCTKFFGKVLPKTPENQEKVAYAAIKANWDKYHDWTKVAQLWNPAGGQSYVNKVMGKLGVAAAPVGPPRVSLASTASPSARGAATAPAAPIAAPLTVVTGAKGRTKGTAAGAISYSLAGTGIPRGISSTAWKSFYSDFMAAVKRGDAIFVDRTSGTPVNYYLPTDLEALSTMVAEMDRINIESVTPSAADHAKAPSGPVVSAALADAIAAFADHQYQLLITAPGATKDKSGKELPETAQTHVPVTSPLAGIDPVYLGLQALEHGKAYIADQRQKAEDAMKVGNYTAAYSYLQNAQDYEDNRLKPQLTGFITLADARMAGIAAASGKEAPESVAKLYGDLVAWDTVIAPERTDVLKLRDELVGTDRTVGVLAVDANHVPIPVKDAAGRVLTYAIAPGKVIEITDDGKVVARDQKAGSYGPDGAFKEAEPDMAPVRVNIGGYTLDAYKKYSIGIVGYTTDGKPLQGRVVTGTLNGQQFRVVENPLNPGHWTANQMLTLAVPQGFTAGPASSAGGTSYQWTGQTPDGRSANMALVWDDKTNRYLVQAVTGGMTGQAQLFDPGDADVQTWLQGQGFTPDLSKMDSTKALFINQPQAYLGWTDDDMRTLIRPQVTSYAQSVVSAAAGFLGWMRGNGKQPTEYAAESQYTATGHAVSPAAAIAKGTAAGYAANADRWWQDSAAKTTALPRSTGTLPTGFLEYDTRTPPKKTTTAPKALPKIKPISTGAKKPGGTPPKPKTPTTSTRDTHAPGHGALEY